MCEAWGHTNRCCVYLVHSVDNLPVPWRSRDIPIFRRSSYFRWSMMLVHLNSVFNPVLYCYRDRRYREAMLEILKIRKPAPVVKRNVRRKDSINTLGDPQEKGRKPRLRSCGSIRNLPNTDDKNTNGKVKWERHSSAPSSETSRVVCVHVHQPKNMGTRPEKQVKGTQYDKIPEMIRSKSLDEQALAWMIGRQRQCRQKATRRAKTAPLMERSRKISEYELVGFKGKLGPKVERSVPTKGDQSHIEDTSRKFQASRFRASFNHWSPLPRSSRRRERTRSKSVAGHEYQQKKTMLGPKRALSASRNKEMATSKLISQIALTRKPHLNVNSGVTTKGSPSHDLEDDTKQLHASRFQAPLHTQSSSLPPKDSRHQCHESIRLESLDEHDPFEVEMRSAHNSEGSDAKTQVIVANFAGSAKRVVPDGEQLQGTEVHQNFKDCQARR